MPKKLVADTYTLTMPGAMLERGFWLYVWRVETPKGEMLYVGRTGDSSSSRANPPYQRMGQHLGHNEKQNPLRKCLTGRKVQPENCTKYDLISYGPIFSEQPDMDKHKGPRDIVAALEKRLADTLGSAGYCVLNSVKCRKPVDEALWSEVQNSFAKYFPKIRKVEVQS